VGGWAEDLDFSSDCSSGGRQARQGAGEKKGGREVEEGNKGMGRWRS